MYSTRRFRKALDHLERANRDCLKICIIKRREQLDSVIADVWFFHGTLTPSLNARYKKIELARTEYFEKETVGDPELIRHLETMLTDISSILHDTQAQFFVPGKWKRKGRMRRAMARWSNPLLILLGSVITSLVTYAARDQIGLILKKIFG